MKITFTMYPEEGARFAPTAFDGQIGKVIPVLADVGVSQATLLKAVVADDGGSAELTVEGDLRIPVEPIDAQSFSFGDAPKVACQEPVRPPPVDRSWLRMEDT